MPTALVKKQWASADRCKNQSPSPFHPRSYRGVFITTIPGDVAGSVHIKEETTDSGASMTCKIDTTKARLVLVTHDNCGDIKTYPEEFPTNGMRGVSVRDLATGVRCIWPHTTTRTGLSSLSMIQAQTGSIWNVTRQPKSLAGEVAVSEDGTVVVAPKADKAGDATEHFTVYNLQNPLSGLPEDDTARPNSLMRGEGESGGEWVWANGRRLCRWTAHSAGDGTSEATKSPSLIIELRDNKNMKKRILNNHFGGDTASAPGFSLPLLAGYMKSIAVVHSGAGSNETAHVLVLGTEQFDQKTNQWIPLPELRVVAFDLNEGHRK